MIQILRFVWNTVAFAACVVAATTLATGPDGKGPWVIALCVVLVAAALQHGGDGTPALRDLKSAR
ncbi:MAG: hypothetical protein H6717_14830 [Polyangiaceae bacterium]|nr:hypothetical protein [Polyangiaceae bacterium]